MGNTLKKEENVSCKLRLLHNQIQKRMEYQKARNEYEPSELTRMQRFTIGFLYHHRAEETYQKDLENEFAISRATASNMLSLMERKGLIERKPVEHDARLKKIVLTEQSMKMYQQVERDIRETEELLTKGMLEIDKQRLHQYLDVMIQNMVGALGECTTTCCGDSTK